MSMSDSFTTTYHVDFWAEDSHQYFSFSQHNEYDAAEECYDKLCEMHPERTFRIRSVDTAITHRVCRKNCGFDIRKVEVLTA